MAESLAKWTHRDLRFVVQTLVPERSDPDRVVDLIHDDEPLLEAMLQDDRLLQQLLADEAAFVSVSPHFFFRVLLLRTRRDLEQELYTVERRHQQKVVLFDASQVVDLLQRPAAFDYLADLLASFTRIETTAVPILVRPGVWRRLRVNDLDVDSLLHYAQLLDKDQRFGVHKRIGDACLFLTGLFPEYLAAQQRYPHSGQPRLRLRSSVLQSLEDYETYGRAFYHLAAGDKAAQDQGLNQILSLLSEQFILAEKPLAFLAERYLGLHKSRLFDL